MTQRDVIKKINSNTEWFPKSYAGFLFGINMQAMGLSKGSSTFPFAQKYGLVFQNHHKKDHWDWFWDSNEMTKKRDMLLERAKKNERFGLNFYSEWKKKYNAYVNCFELLASSNPENFGHSTSLIKFKELYNLLVEAASYGYVVDAFLTNAEEDWLVGIIKKEIGTKTDTETIHALIAPIFSSFVNDYEIALLEASLLLTQGKKQAYQEKILDIEKKFFWIKTNYYDYQRLTASQIVAETKIFAKKIKNIKAVLLAKKTQANKSASRKQSLIKKLKLSKVLQNIIRISELFSEIQDKRKECVLRNNTIFYEMMERLAAQKKFDKNLIRYILHDELFKLLKNKTIDWQRVQSRYDNGVLILYFSGTFYEISSEKINTSIVVENLFPQLSAVTELKGSPAFKGLVKGTVRVLHNTKEIAKFPKGAILVANQTTPEFVPAMKIAKAIITDQGGITSHAAIISRELKIPAIVGVKNATKILKDGDLVEVDANNGIIKRIK
jgi:phosphohistidine swiveling domain-containing protein